MLVLTLAVLAIVGAMENRSLFAQQNDAAAKVGDHLVIRMTGNLAKQYARCIGSRLKNEAPAGLMIETTATIVQKLDDGQVRIEHVSHINRNGNPMCLVTLTATVNSSKITSDVVVKGTVVYASPLAHQKGAKGTPTQEDTKTLRLQLSELKGLKLRTWSLAEEIGD
jgi:hypothetical protein